VNAAGSPASARAPRTPGRTAREQIEQARARVQAARQRARERMAARRGIRSDFRPINAGVVGSTFVFLAMCVGAAFFMLSQGRRAHYVHIVTDGPSDGKPGLAYAQIDLPEGKAVPALHAPTKPGRPAWNTPRLVVNGSAVVPKSQASADLPVKAHGQRALIVSDIIPLTDSLTAAIARLHDTGFTVMGNYPGSTASADEAAVQDELVASARAIRNVGSLTAPDVSESLSHWVASEDEVDLLVWFARPDPKQAAKAFVFSAWHDPSESPSDEDRQTLQSAIGALDAR
jgi:hypothetical protein